MGALSHLVRFPLDTSHAVRFIPPIKRMERAMLTDREKKALDNLFERALPDMVQGLPMFEAMGRVVERDRYIVNTVLDNRPIKRAVSDEMVERVYHALRAA